ncbi:ABC transporter permease [Candidatus Bipolaricaulota bacterium]|nr:ABC transporter permease [Candidatus Bipolaricaulota bacterium]
MLHYLAKRLFLLIFTLLGLSVVIFVVSHIAPGDPARLAAGPFATAEMVEHLKEELGLDKSLPEQYGIFLTQLLKGDLGRSIRTRRPVREDLARFFPATLELVLVSLSFAVLTGILLGVLSAVHQNRWIDHLSRLVSISGLGLPAFWLALMLQLLFVLQLDLLPGGGRIGMIVPKPTSITRLFLIDSLLTGNWVAFNSALRHIILPALSLSFPALASIIRISRADVLDTLRQDFVTTARAKGLVEKLVIWKHVLKNSLISTVTMIGLRFGWMLGGTILVETVFDWPGVGLYAVTSATHSDFQPIMGAALLIGLSFAIANLIVDLSYSFLDPRIGYE